MLGLYLLGKRPDEEFVRRYCEAMALGACGRMNSWDERLWRIGLRSPRSMKLIDSGLAMHSPFSPVRQRLLLMLAILEASPANSDQFLPKKYGKLDFIKLAGVVFRMTLAAVLGWLVVAFLRFRYSRCCTTSL